MSSCYKPSLTTAILESYYPKVQDLCGYLSDILEPDENGRMGFLPDADDSEAYRSLVNASYVALTSLADLPRKRIHVFPPMAYMREILDRAQERLFSKRKGGRPSNVITCGYRMASQNGETGRRAISRIGITNYFVNTIITALQAPEWETLLQRVGADVMLHLLTEACVFVSLPNECLCQMTGDPIVHLSAPTLFRPSTMPETKNKHLKKRKSSGVNLDERPSKRLRLQSTTIARADSWVVNGVAMSKESTTDVVTFSPADMPLVRARVFYARPTRVPQANHIVVGLPPKHILNRLNPSYARAKKPSVDTYVDPDPRKQAEDARQLAKYVFPRQYGLLSPFALITSKREAFLFPDFLDREDEIKGKGPCKTPKRLKETLGMLEKMIWRHGKCGYKPLRDHACPSKIKTDDAQQMDSTVILEMMSEQSIQLRSQAPNISFCDTSVVPHGLSQAEKHVKHKPRFVEFACSHHEVYCFVALVTKAVIPKNFWGCASNFKLTMTYVKEFISARRYETITLHRVLQGFSTSECEWLAPSGPQHRVSVTDALKRRELLEEFLWWYFDGFLIPLLKTTFYITDSSAFRNQVLYFRQDDWEVLCKPLMERLTVGTFEKIPQFEAEEILRQRKLGFSFVRLLPKETGVRPIVNLRRRKPIRKGPYAPPEQSINQILQSAFQILSYEKQTQPQLLGASVFGPNEVYNKLKQFKAALPRGTEGELPKLFFVKVDVQACFDTIEQTKLLEILRHLISEDIYMIQRYGRVTSVTGKIRRTYKKAATPADDHPHFLQYATQLAGALRNMIFVDQVVYPYSKKQEILHLLEEHITENIVKIGSDYYRQMVGIPQGSVLSSLLCSFFYGDLEKRFGTFTEDSHSVMMRLIDDYLYVTTSLSKARGFLSTMNSGHPEYGCFISKDKTLTNFDHDCQVMNVTAPRQTHFPWCGYLIDMKDLSVLADYTRYRDIPISDSLTVEKGRRAGATFLSKMLQLAKAKSHIIYCDTELNTDRVVYSNIYQNFVLAAMKMMRYIQIWGIDIKKSAKFIYNTVQQMIRYTYATIRNKSASQSVKVRGKSDIQRLPVIWLGTHAFHAVFSRKPQIHQYLLKSLTFELSLPKYRRSRKRFRGLVAQALAGMAEISI